MHTMDTEMELRAAAVSSFEWAKVTADLIDKLLKDNHELRRLALLPYLKHADDGSTYWLVGDISCGNEDGAIRILRGEHVEPSPNDGVRTDTPCAFCGREEDGHWYIPCPSDDCPSNNEDKDKRPKGVTVTCKFCKQKVSSFSAHLHQDEWIGDACCWEERLRSTE